jgi:hypothetical protein
MYRVTPAVVGFPDHRFVDATRTAKVVYVDPKVVSVLAGARALEGQPAIQRAPTRVSARAGARSVWPPSVNPGARARADDRSVRPPSRSPAREAYKWPELDPEAFEAFCSRSDANKGRMRVHADAWSDSDNSTEDTEEAFIDALSFLYRSCFLIYVNSNGDNNWRKIPSEIRPKGQDTTVVGMHNEDGHRHYIAIDPQSATAEMLYKDYDKVEWKAAGTVHFFDQDDRLHENEVATGNQNLCFYFSWIAFEEGQYSKDMKERVKARKTEAVNRFLELDKKYRDHLNEIETTLTNLGKLNDEDLTLAADKTASNEYEDARRRLALRRIAAWAEAFQESQFNIELDDLSPKKQKQWMWHMFPTKTKGQHDPKKIVFGAADLRAVNRYMVGDETDLANPIWRPLVHTGFGPHLKQIANKLKDPKWLPLADRLRLVEWCKMWGDEHRAHPKECEKVPFWDAVDKALKAAAVFEEEGSSQAVAKKYADSGLRVAIMVSGDPGRPGGLVMKANSTGLEAGWRSATKGGQEESVMRSWLGGLEDNGDPNTVYAKDKYGKWVEATEAQQLAFSPMGRTRTNYVVTEERGSVFLKHRGGGGKFEVRRGKPAVTDDDLEGYMRGRIGDQARNGMRWGLENPEIPATSRTGHLYTNLEIGEYDMAFTCEKEPIKEKGQPFTADLIFALGPNLGGRPGPLTVNPYSHDNDYDNYRQCVKTGIEAAMRHMAALGATVGVIARLVDGARTESNTYEQINDEYVDIVKEIVHEDYKRYRGMSFAVQARDGGGEAVAQAEVVVDKPEGFVDRTAPTPPTVGNKKRIAPTPVYVNQTAANTPKAAGRRRIAPTLVQGIAGPAAANPRLFDSQAWILKELSSEGGEWLSEVDLVRRLPDGVSNTTLLGLSDVLAKLVESGKIKVLSKEETKYYKLSPGADGHVDYADAKARIVDQLGSKEGVDRKALVMEQLRSSGGEGVPFAELKKQLPDSLIAPVTKTLGELVEQGLIVKRGEGDDAKYYLEHTLDDVKGWILYELEYGDRLDEYGLSLVVLLYRYTKSFELFGSQSEATTEPFFNGLKSLVDDGKIEELKGIITGRTKHDYYRLVK